MKKNVFGQVENKVTGLEKEYGSLENFFISTICPERHMLRMKEAYASFAPTMKNVYQDLNALENTDLLDFKVLQGAVYGEFD